MPEISLQPYACFNIASGKISCRDLKLLGNSRQIKGAQECNFLYRLARLAVQLKS